jgi:hypothetical protein
MNIIHEILNKIPQEYNGSNFKEMIGPRGRIADTQDHESTQPENALLDSRDYKIMSEYARLCNGSGQLDNIPDNCVIDLSRANIEYAIANPGRHTEEIFLHLAGM